jgi:hypothetical protein
MAVKSKVKSKASVKSKPGVKKIVRATTTKNAVQKSAHITRTVENSKPARDVARRPARSLHSSSGDAVVVNRVVNPIVERRPVMPRTPRVHQFSYMRAPGIEHEFEVGDNVEVFCDHEKNRDRVRGWIKGIVVQVDNKMVAVQFRSNVFLTDGWMVPDRILWYPLTSEHIRPVPGKKTAAKKDFIPDY